MNKKEFLKIYNKALEIAFDAHRGQKDRGGESYIMHPIRVSQRCKTYKAKIIAILHDVLEDTDITPEIMVENGIPQELVDWVEVLSRKSDMLYQEYIKRIALFDITTEVKLADLEDNMDISRLVKELDEKDFERLKKYKKAYEYLKGNEKIYD